MPKTKRQQLESRLAALKSARRSWEPTWRDIAEQMLPYRLVLSTQERNRGNRKDHAIINSKPLEALGTLAAGLMAGITSPGRPWFGLTVSDPELAEYPSVRQYLDDCQRIIAAQLQVSNWYDTLANGTYPDAGAFGTSLTFVEEHPGGLKGKPGVLLHFDSRPLGEYYLDVDHLGDVDTCFRELSLTVRQIVQKFGRDACSRAVRTAWDRGDYHQEFVVVHAVYPNEEVKPDKLGPEGMAWASTWWERDDGRDLFLREAGYHEFPILAPRWSTRPGDIYGRGPGWVARGDCRALQHYERQLLKMIDKTVDPPMRVVGKVDRASLLPGDLTHIAPGQGHTFEPAMHIQPAAIGEVKEHIARYENRIEVAFFVHLWQAMLNDDRAQRPTATEVEARRQEVMLMLGPVLENLDNGLLEPAVTRAFNVLDRADMLPMPPPELQGSEVRVQFMSILHQMQQQTGLIGLRTLLQETANVAALRPEVVDKLNGDVIVEEIQRMVGARQDVLLTKDEVEAVRRRRAEQEQVEQDGAAMLAATEGARNLANFDATKLSEVASALSPVAAAQAGALAPIRGWV